MANASIRMVSPPPALGFDADENIERMVEWFRANFEDPANSLPYESKEGGYQWLFGGPYDAGEELSSAFPDADDERIDGAVERLQRGGVLEWTVSAERIFDEGITWHNSPDDEAEDYRVLPPEGHQRAFTIVETLLFPQAAQGWCIRATFIPGTTNMPLGTELEGEDEVLTTEDGDLITSEDGEPLTVEAQALVRRQFDSLRQLVAGLIDQQLEGQTVPRGRDLEAARDWVRSLERDSDLFVDDAVVVHASPPAWMPLGKIVAKQVGEATGASAIVISGMANGHLFGYLLAYGGARIFLEIVRGSNYVVAATFERIGNRIRRGDFDKGPKDKIAAKPAPKLIK